MSQERKRGGADRDGTSQDLRQQIAEPQARAQSLREGTTERLQALLAEIPDIVMEVDNNKVYTWANEPGRRFFGDDVIGKEASYYFEGEQTTYQLVGPLFEGSEQTIYVESWQRRRDGQKRLLAWWCRVLKNPDGTVRGALSTARDITDEREGAQTRAPHPDARRYPQRQPAHRARERSPDPGRANLQAADREARVPRLLDRDARRAGPSRTRRPRRVGRGVFSALATGAAGRIARVLRQSIRGAGRDRLAGTEA